MSINQIGPKLWHLRVQWRDPKTGRKRSNEERFEGTKRDATLREAKMRSDAKDAGERRQRLRLEAFARSWMLARQPRLKPSVVRRYAAALDGHILPALGDYYLDKLERDDVQAYVAARTASGAQGNTVLNELRLLRSMARDAVADEVCAKNWADRVTPPKVRKWTEDRPNMLTAEQLGRVLANVPKAWLPIVTLTAFTGLRWGEVSALRWSDIDEDAGSVKVRRGNYRGHLGEAKTAGSHRTVPLPPALAAMFKASRRGRSSELLFPNSHGTIYKGWPLVKVMKKACAAAGVLYTTPHGLRRTFNNLARQVAAAQVVKSITGHATDAMLEHYSMVGLGEKADATRLVMQLVEATIEVAPDDDDDDPDPPEPAPASSAVAP